MTTNGHGISSNFSTTLPTTNSPRVQNIRGFIIATQKLPILKAGPIDEMTKTLGIAPPEMIFGDNFVAIAHPPSQWEIRFSALGALSCVDKTGEKRLKVAYSREWQQSREDNHDFQELEEVKPFDWSYTPQNYKGDLSPDSPAFQGTETPIPLELLRRPDPILFFDDVILYEDELADNGIAMLSVKIRVMPDRLLLLSRFFMRLDGVLIRVNDTRVYVEFKTQEVIREHIEKERAYEEIKDSLAGRADVAAAMRDPNQMAEMLPIVAKSLERLTLK